MCLGAKGVIECELTSTGERWGRGPRKDVHSSNKARLDSPAWHLVEALASLVSPDGNDPAIEGYAAKARPLSSAEKKMVGEAARRIDRKSTRLNSSHGYISYAVFCLKKKKNTYTCISKR